MLNAKLEAFARNNLVIPYQSTERAKIRNSLEVLQARAKNWFGDACKGVVTFGSWERNTILPRSYDPDSDLDVMLLFDPDQYRMGGSESARDRVRGFALNKYATSEVHLDKPCVKLELGHIKFDLVPAIQQQWVSGYMIPDGNNQWMSTDPDQLSDRLTKVNKQVGDNLVRRVLRLCKYWNKSKEGARISSYYLESAVIDVLPWIPIPYGQLSFSTYDGFLHSVKRICSMYYVQFQNSTAPAIISYIEDARARRDYNGQITWMRHLLPDFV